MKLDLTARIFFSKGKQHEFLTKALKMYKCRTRKELADKIDISTKTLELWMYEQCSLPESIYQKIILEIPQLNFFETFILEKKERFWGQKVGGKNAIKTIIQRYGMKEIKRRQISGGKKTGSLVSKKNEIKIKINSYFSEFLGVLYGDGCISKIRHGNRLRKIIAIAGNKIDDIHHFHYLQVLIKNIINRKPKIKESKNTNAIYLYFQCNSLFDFLVDNFNFPIGIKKNLTVPKKILNSDLKSIKSFIKGVFDTDGSLYFEKNNTKKYYYPVIEICMYEKIFLDKIKKLLIKMGFKVLKHKNSIRLKGKENLEKWMKIIGSNNLKHISKYKIWKICGECLPDRILPLKERIRLLSPGSSVWIFKPKRIAPP